MITKQVKFLDEGCDEWIGGILVDDGEEKYIICGCCGGIFEESDFEFMDIVEYDSWADISYEIMGDM